MGDKFALFGLCRIPGQLLTLGKERNRIVYSEPRKESADAPKTTIFDARAVRRKEPDVGHLHAKRKRTQPVKRSAGAMFQKAGILVTFT